MIVIALNLNYELCQTDFGSSKTQLLLAGVPLNFVNLPKHTALNMHIVAGSSKNRIRGCS